MHDEIFEERDAVFLAILDEHVVAVTDDEVHESIEIDARQMHVVDEIDELVDDEVIDAVREVTDETFEFVEYEVIEVTDVIDDEADDADEHVIVAYPNDDADEIQYDDVEVIDDGLKIDKVNYNMHEIDDLVFGVHDELVELHDEVLHITLEHFDENDEILCIEHDEIDDIEFENVVQVHLIVIQMIEYDEREVMLRDDNID